MELKRTTRRLLEAIEANERGSYKEWMTAIGARSTAVICYHLEKLVKAGKVRRTPGRARSIVLTRE